MWDWAIFRVGLMTNFCRFWSKMIFKSFVYGGDLFQPMIRDAYWVSFGVFCSVRRLARFVCGVALWFKFGNYQFLRSSFAIFSDFPLQVLSLYWCITNFHWYFREWVTHVRKCSGFGFHLNWEWFQYCWAGLSCVFELPDQPRFQFCCLSLNS